MAERLWPAMGVFLMVTHGTAGDVLPFIGLGRCLRARGHQVVLLTHAPYQGRAERAGLEFIAVDTDEQYARVLAGTPAQLAIRDPAELLDFYRRTGLLDRACVEIDALARRHQPGRTVLIGRQGSAISMLIAAELLGAPASWLAVCPSQLVTAPIFAHFMKTGLASGVNEIRASVGLPPVGDWSAWLHSPQARLGLWPRWFDEAGIRAPAGTHLVGFLPGDDDPDPKASPDADADGRGPGGPEGDSEPGEIPGRGRTPGMDAGDSAPGNDRPSEATRRDLVLITGGTSRVLHERFYPVALAAAAACGRPALVVTPHRDLLPDPLPPGVAWLASAPFWALIPRVAAVIHHGGVGTSVRSLRAGTPQVILADSLDRPDNARRLAALDLARWAPPGAWQAAAVAGLLGEALADAGYSSRASARLAHDDPGAAAAAARVLESLLGLTHSAPVGELG